MMAGQVEQWRDYNRTWLDTNLGGEAADEYKAASTHGYGYGWAEDPASNLRYLIRETETEIAKLQSIHRRLPIWSGEPRTTASNPIARASHGAPIFIVHGSDTLRAESVAHTVTSATGRKTIILRDEPNFGRTLIEKFEQNAAEVSYAIIVLTADDQGSHAEDPHTRPRGRQNVIFEMGYFFGRIGRGNVSVLLRPGVEKPSDMDGIVYITFDDNRAWKTELLRELRHAGFDVQL